MHTLRQFYNHLHAQGDMNVRSSWKYNAYETKLGIREEIVFVGSVIIFQMTPPEQGLSLIVSQTNEIRVYRHALYLMSMACPFFLETNPRFKITTYGQGYQGFIGLKSAGIEPFTAEGIIERTNRHGQVLEQPVSKILGVTITPLIKEMQ